jgi:hypothetical protein
MASPWKQDLVRRRSSFLSHRRKPCQKRREENRRHRSRNASPDLRPRYHAGAVILCGSSLRPPSALGPIPLVQLASDTGCGGVALEGGCRLPEVPLLAAKALRVRLAVPLLVAPMPEHKLAPHRRLPSLVALGNREERAAAVDMVRLAMQTTRDLGVKTVVLDFGRVALAVGEPEIRAHFARRELDEGEVGHAAFQAVLADRKRRGEQILDGCRAALDPLVREAERHAIRLALLPAATPWQVPSPRETTTLLEEFEGAPVASVYSPARLLVLQTLGLGVSASRREALRRAAAVDEAVDVVGLELPHLAGVGEIDFEELTTAPEDALIVLTGPPETSDAEVAAVRPRLERPTPAAPTVVG